MATEIKVRTALAAISGEALVVDYEGQEIRFTISLGVADLGQRTQDHQQLIDWADRALYQSKHGGRNQVSVHGG